MLDIPKKQEWVGRNARELKYALTVYCETRLLEKKEGSNGFLSGNSQTDPIKNE